jgi:hypothetical protein
MSFESPATASIGPKPADLAGHLLIIKPVEYKTGIETSLGTAEAISCSVVDLDTNESFDDVLFFNVALRSGLKSKIGSQVLCRIGQGIAKPGKSAPWILVDATSDASDLKRATDYVAGAFKATVAPAASPSSLSASDLANPAIQALLQGLGATPTQPF